MFYGYRLVAVAFLAQFVSIGLFSYVLGAFFLPMTEEFAWSRAEFTTARSIGQFVMGVAGFVIGSYVDRYGGRPLMLLGTVVLTAVLALHAQVSELWQWIVLNGIGLVLGCALIGNLVVNVTLAKWFVEHRGRAIAWAAMGVSLAGILITPAVTWCIDLLGWRDSWTVLAIATFIIMLPTSLAMRRNPEDYGLHPDGKSAGQIAAGEGALAAADLQRSLTRAQALRTVSFYGLVLAFALFSINILVVLLQTIPYLTDAGYPRVQAALAISVASVPALISKPIWGFYIDRSAPKPLAALGAAVTGLSLLGIVFSIQAQSLALVYVAYFFLGIGWGGMIPLQEVIWASFFRAASPRRRAQCRAALYPGHQCQCATARECVSRCCGQLSRRHGRGCGV